MLYPSLKFNVSYYITKAGMYIVVQKRRSRNVYLNQTQIKRKKLFCLLISERKGSYIFKWTKEISVLIRYSSSQLSKQKMWNTKIEILRLAISSFILLQINKTNCLGNFLCNVWCCVATKQGQWRHRLINKRISYECCLHNQCTYWWLNMNFWKAIIKIRWSTSNSYLWVVIN